MGGLGGVLGRLPSRGVWERLDEAYDCFKQAIRVVEPLDQPRLLRDLQGRFGEFCHEVGDWPGSFQACAVAVEIAYSLFDEFATRESRLVELQETRGFALCAAYAAFRLDRLDEAVRFAEAQRARSLVDVISAAEILRRAPIDVRDTILEILSRIAALESERASAGDDDPEVMLDRQRRKLADYLGVHPDLVGARLTGTAKEKLEQARTDPDRHTTALAQARQQLREAIAGASPATTDRFSKALDAGSIADIAGRARRPLVYLLSTVHGGAALVVSPEGELTGVPLDELTSDETRDLVDGEGNDPGFARAAFQGDNDALSASLERCLQVLSEKAMKPLSRWLTAHDHPGAILIPLGRLGLLPLHAAGAQGVYSYAPSARSLSISLAAGESKPRRPKLVVIAAPTREDERPLPFAVAAARSIEASAKQEQTPVSVLVREQASSASVRTAAGDGTLIHFACHGRFRPSDPLESHLLLGGEERLTVADVFAGAVDLFGARLVTLSACQTGNVEYYANPDESIGFPAALLLAGVRSVVTTLWPVDDAATALLCVHMYERIFADGEDCVTALELARDWLRNATADKLQIAAKQLRAALQDSDDDEDAALSRLWRNLAFREPESVPYATPEYWAGFVHVGA